MKEQVGDFLLGVDDKPHKNYPKADPAKIVLQDMVEALEFACAGRVEIEGADGKSTFIQCTNAPAEENYFYEGSYLKYNPLGKRIQRKTKTSNRRRWNTHLKNKFRKVRYVITNEGLDGKSEDADRSVGVRFRPTDCPQCNLPRSLCLLTLCEGRRAECGSPVRKRKAAVSFAQEEPVGSLPGSRNSFSEDRNPPPSVDSLEGPDVTISRRELMELIQALGKDKITDPEILFKKNGRVTVKTKAGDVLFEQKSKKVWSTKGCSNITCSGASTTSHTCSYCHAETRHCSERNYMIAFSCTFGGTDIDNSRKAKRLNQYF